MTIPEHKKQLRKWAKETRATLPIIDISQAIVQHLQAWETYRQAKHILSYLAFGSEIDLSPLHQDSSRTFYVTKTSHDQLSVHELGDLELHPYGFLQPAKHLAAVDPKIIDLVLVPGLCFDQQGTRLGYGKGYYDQLLPKLSSAPLNTVPFVGISANALVVKTVPKESFDVLVTHLVTEAGVIYRRQETGGRRQ
jgi:5-formyltetrahydrofolate cyclo-ligase